MPCMPVGLSTPTSSTEVNLKKEYFEKTVQCWKDVTEI